MQPEPTTQQQLNILENLHTSVKLRTHKTHMNKNKIIESMTKFVLDDYYNFGYQHTMRIWREEDTLKNEYDKKDLKEFVHKSYKKHHKNTAKLAEVVGEFKRVNAVEIVNPN